MAKSNENFDIHVRAQLMGTKDDEKTPETSAYAFSSEGGLLASAPLDAKGAVTLKVPASASVARMRVVVGPRLADDATSFRELIRRGGQEQHLRIDPKITRYDVAVTILPDIWRCWLLGFCVVRGNLNKRVLIGGTYENFPVCNATVEVYEVDPLWIIIPKLPDLVLDKIREIIIDPRPLPLPIPEPGPDPAPFARAAMLQERAEVHHRMDADAAMTLKQLSGATNLRYMAQMGSKLQFQQALIDNAVLIRPLLCLFWPRFVTMQLVATAVTDECGHFQTFFFKGCNNPDTPDLYFKAKQKLFGWLNVYIYAPTPIPCYTWWNYACGTEVNLYTSSPWAQTCSPCPPVIGPPGKNKWVAFMSIGAHGLNNIYGTATDLTADATNRGLTQDGRPWGGMLLPRLEFSNALEAAGVRYYRLRWRNHGAVGTEIDLNGEVHHYYRHDVPTAIGDMPVWTPETLGPIPVGATPNLFKIPFPSVAPAGVWDTPPDIAEIKEHFANGRFPSQTIAPGTQYSTDGSGLIGADTSGKYDILVDLFDAAGHQVDIGALGIVYAVPEDPDSSGEIKTVDASTLGLVEGNSMVVTLHVDNNLCFALIDPPTIDAAVAEPCCGVLKYHPGDSVSMSWQAKHPHNFAAYSFRVVRATEEVVLEGGSVAASAITSPITRTVDFMMTHHLPGGCAPCQVAGFSENLYVDSLATDGWSTELGYDDSDVRAFVLSKH